MGIRGAAIATVMSRFCGMILTLSYIHFHHKLIDWRIPEFNELLTSWKKIMTIGVPGIDVSLLPQIIRLTLISLTAYTGGTIAVAAIAVGSRIEGFTLLIANAIGISIVPLVGQNYGAKDYRRVNDIRVMLNRASVLVGFGMLILTFLLAKPFVTQFTQDPAVIELTIAYLIILTVGSIGLNLYNFTSQAFNAIGQSLKVLMINGFGTVLIILPLMFAGSRLSFRVMLIGLALGQLMVGGISVYYGKRYLDIKEQVALDYAS